MSPRQVKEWGRGPDRSSSITRRAETAGAVFKMSCRVHRSTEVVHEFAAGGGMFLLGVPRLSMGGMGFWAGVR